MQEALHQVEGALLNFQVAVACAPGALFSDLIRTRNDSDWNQVFRALQLTGLQGLEDGCNLCVPDLLG